MYAKCLLKDFIFNFLLFKLISQIRVASIVDDRELVIQSLYSFLLASCLTFNNDEISKYTS